MSTMIRSTELGASTKVFFRVMSQPVRWALTVTAGGAHVSACPLAQTAGRCGHSWHRQFPNFDYLSFQDRLQGIAATLVTEKLGLEAVFPRLKETMGLRWSSTPCWTLLHAYQLGFSPHPSLSS